MSTCWNTNLECDSAAGRYSCHSMCRMLIYGQGLHSVMHCHRVPPRERRSFQAPMVHPACAGMMKPGFSIVQHMPAGICLTTWLSVGLL